MKQHVFPAFTAAIILFFVTGNCFAQQADSVKQAQFLALIKKMQGWFLLASKALWTGLTDKLPSSGTSILSHLPQQVHRFYNRIPFFSFKN